MSISDGELARYDKDGAVVIDTPFSSAELDRGEAAWDRLKVSGDWIDTDPDLVDMIQHPFMEEVARMVLRANGVHLWWSLSTHARPPWTEAFDSEAEQWASGAHADIQATLEDFEATPRRMRAELWLWLNDAPVDRGAMRVLPGSHREIMAHWSRILTDAHKAQLPRCHGLGPWPVPETSHAYPEHIPELRDLAWTDHEPTPVTARRGQLLVLCSAGLHSAWQNCDSVPRKALLTSWIGAGVTGALPTSQRDSVIERFPRLRERLRPERRHLVPDTFDWLLESDYEPKWPETFPPGHR